jgi:hypothetical protein
MLSVLLFVLSTFSEYQASYKQYLTAKNQYIQYRTSSTRQEAVNKTSKLLLDRNRLILDYLKSLGETSLNSELYSWEKNIKFSDTISEINKVSLDWESRLEQIIKISNKAKLLILKNHLQTLQENLIAISAPEKMTSGNAKLFQEKLRISQNKRDLVIFDNSYWSYENFLSYLKESKDALSSATQLVYEATPRP